MTSRRSFPDRLAIAGIGRCTLQMLRLQSPGYALPGAVISDLSLVRYGGFAICPRPTRCGADWNRSRANICVTAFISSLRRGSDGSLVVGDSHRYDAAAAPFADEGVYQLLLDEYRALTGRPPPAVRERWTGTYAVAKTASRVHRFAGAEHRAWSW